MDGIALLTITVLSVFVGFEVVSKVSSTSPESRLVFSVICESSVVTGRSA